MNKLDGLDFEGEKLKCVGIITPKSDLQVSVNVVTTRTEMNELRVQT